jgi:hypothetical protein
MGRIQKGKSTHTISTYNERAKIHLNYQQSKKGEEIE